MIVWLSGPSTPVYSSRCDWAPLEALRDTSSWSPGPNVSEAMVKLMKLDTEGGGGGGPDDASSTRTQSWYPSAFVPGVVNSITPEFESAESEMAMNAPDAGSYQRAVAG